MAKSAGKKHRAETIADRMRVLRVAMSVTLPKLGLSRGQRPRSAVPRIGRKGRAKTDR